MGSVSQLIVVVVVVEWNEERKNEIDDYFWKISPSNRLTWKMLQNSENKQKFEWKRKIRCRFFFRSHLLSTLKSTLFSMFKSCWFASKRMCVGVVNCVCLNLNSLRSACYVKSNTVPSCGAGWSVMAANKRRNTTPNGQKHKKFNKSIISKKNLKTTESIHAWTINFRMTCD